MWMNRSTDDAGPTVPGRGERLRWRKFGHHGPVLQRIRQADHALLLDCRTLDWDAVPLSNDVALVIADTGTRRTLATSKYNERRAECEQAVEALRAALPDIRALRDVPVEVFHTHKHMIPQPARDRAQHVVEEIARVLAAADALRRGSTDVLGQWMDESHISSRDLYAASGPELDAMWEASQRHPARLGGRFSARAGRAA
jgi:galactokinase